MLTLATTTKRDMCLQASSYKISVFCIGDSNSDYLMVLGDRFETLGAVFAAHLWVLKLYICMVASPVLEQ